MCIFNFITESIMFHTGPVAMFELSRNLLQTNGPIDNRVPRTA